MTLGFETVSWDFAAARCDHSWGLGYDGKSACTQSRYVACGTPFQIQSGKTRSNT